MLDFLYIPVSWVLLRWHQLLSFIGMNPDSGLTWALSIILLVITARLLLFRLFVKQVHYQRNMQKMQPKIKKLREKYKDDRAELNREMMKLQQEEGFNPISGCLPLVAQLPIFLALYHVLRHLSAAGSATYRMQHPDRLTLYTFTKAETLSGAQAKLFGAPLASSFKDSSALIHQLGGADVTTTRIVLAVLLVISASATFGTQLLVRISNTAPPAEGTAATVQKYMLYLIPVGTLASGLLFNFPLGVLLYWFASNLWTFGQQAYVIKFHPPDEEVAAPVGELGKTLAPRPGQRPNRGRTSAGAAAGSAVSLDKSDGSGGSGGTATDTVSLADEPDITPGAAPRPGQRPHRSGGKRPPGKRPTQTKKRR